MSFLCVDNPLNNSRHSLPNHTLSQELPSLRQSSSTAITNGYFANNIMKKIEKASNLDLDKVTIKKKKIGRGTSAFVHLAIYNKFEIALKEYKFKESENLDDNTLSEFENELNILSLLDHSNIIQLYGFHLNIHKKVLNFAFEYSKIGNLFQFIHPLFDINYEYKTMLNILYDIAKGMKYLHSVNIINRDLKPKNLLLFDNFKIKLTDFGSAVAVDYDCYEFEEYKLYDVIGTDGYKAPEIIKIDSDEGYDYKVDIFSFGSICYELYTKKYVSGIKYLTRFVNLKHNLHRTLISTGWPHMLRDLILDCWQFDPAKRPTFVDIFNKLNTMIM